MARVGKEWQGNGKGMTTKWQGMAREWQTARLGLFTARRRPRWELVRGGRRESAAQTKRGIAARNLPAAQQGRARGDDGQSKMSALPVRPGTGGTRSARVTGARRGPRRAGRAEWSRLPLRSRGPAWRPRARRNCGAGGRGRGGGDAEQPRRRSQLHRNGMP